MTRSRLVVRLMLGYDWFGFTLAGLGSGDVLNSLITRRLGFVTWVLAMNGLDHWLVRMSRAQSWFMIIKVEDIENFLELGVGGRDLGSCRGGCDGRNAEQKKETDERARRHVGLGGLATSLGKDFGMRWRGRKTLTMR